MAQRDTPIVHLEEGWAIMQEGIDKLVKMLQDEVEVNFTAEEYIYQYATIMNMCTQRPPHQYPAQLYERYKLAFSNYLRDKVLKKVEAQGSGPHLLKELQIAWDKHAVMVRWLTRFFNYLDRYYVQRRDLPKLKTVALMAFREELYDKVRVRVMDALVEQMRQERAEEQTESQLIEKIIEIIIAVSPNQHDAYRTDFESYLLEAVHKHYEAKAREWIVSNTCAEYLKKGEAAIDAEAARPYPYLHSDTKELVLQATREELLLRVQSELIHMDSGCSAMLRDNKTEDLMHMCELYSTCGPRQIDPIVDMFRQHGKAKGMLLVKQATEAVNRGGEGSGGNGGGLSGDAGSGVAIGPQSH